MFKWAVWKWDSIYSHIFWKCQNNMCKLRKIKHYFYSCNFLTKLSTKFTKKRLSQGLFQQLFICFSSEFLLHFFCISFWKIFSWISSSYYLHRRYAEKWRRYTNDKVTTEMGTKNNQNSLCTMRSCLFICKPQPPQQTSTKYFIRDKSYPFRNSWICLF